MINIIILLSIWFLQSCGSQNHTQVGNAHLAYESVRWNSEDFPLIINADLDQFPENSPEKLALEYSAYKWNQALGFEAISIKYSQIDYTNDYFSISQFTSDDQFTLSSSGDSSNIFEIQKLDSIAITAYTYDTFSKRIFHADIVLNHNKTTSTDLRPETYDLETIYMHEMGHFLGLSHSDEFEDYYSVMRPEVGTQEVVKNLSSGDIYKIRKLYNLLN